MTLYEVLTALVFPATKVKKPLPPRGERPQSIHMGDAAHGYLALRSRSKRSACIAVWGVMAGVCCGCYRLAFVVCAAVAIRGPRRSFVWLVADDLPTRRLRRASDGPLEGDSSEKADNAPVVRNGQTRLELEARLGTRAGLRA